LRCQIGLQVGREIKPISKTQCTASKTTKYNAPANKMLFTDCQDPEKTATTKNGSNKQYQKLQK
jgi:hypothetical protein